MDTHAEKRDSSCRCAKGRADRLRNAVEHAAHFLPAQGPIGVFIHHNTLHAFEHLPFEEAVVKAAELYGTEPYMSEQAYLDAVGLGRIRMSDIEAILAAEPDTQLWPGMTRREFRWRLIVPGLRQVDPETIQWEFQKGEWCETPALWSLFEACLSTVLDAKANPPSTFVRTRERVLSQTGVDMDAIVNPWVVRICAAFTDQGMAYWEMPKRAQGLLEAAKVVLNAPSSLLPAELATLPARMAEIANRHASAEHVVTAAFDRLDIPEQDWEVAVTAELLALPGWAGMIHRLESEPELAPHEVVPASLMDFLAVRMLLTLAAADSIRVQGAPSKQATGDGELAEAAMLFEAAARLGMTNDAAPASKLPVIQAELTRFHSAERRRIFHLAYERRHERQVLLPLAEHRRRGSVSASDRLTAQVFFCIDEREESIRRHLEEVALDVETFGAAGFFGAAINYKGLDDAHGVALCPVVVKPAHAVTERPVEGHWGAYERRRQMRRDWARVMREWSVSSRTLVRGWIGTTVLGVFSLVPMAARVLSPRRYASLAARLNSAVLPEPRTELAFERQDEAGRAAAHGLMEGFTVAERVDRVAAVLEQAGLKRGMARLVVILGHGSTSLNNPHESAHDCGACGGRRGGPNARLFAAMANHPQVRTGLRERGIAIPDDTWFLGGYHDTCNDHVEFYDLEAVPSGHLADLGRLRLQLDEARARSARERARRFEAAGWPDTASQGLRHVQERAEHLAEPRPEYGHCTNAVCIVGRRSSTRGLFLDRRAFLVSYDAAQDPANESLAKLLGAAIPVCSGISLEYYFSFVDNEGYGCGTKLPHNVTGLVGVMNGYEGDLRTGLPLQMVEIHEPVRILFVIESTPERILPVIQANPMLWQLLRNRWIRLASMDPETGAVLAYRDDRWEPVEGDDEMLGTAPSSLAWYDGNRDHLPLARIELTPQKVAARG